MKKQLVMGTLAAAMTMGAMAPAMAEGLGASAGLASAYLWRGFDLGNGSPAVWGDLNYKVAGAYAGVWASSGDDTLGSEYDYYIGYGLEAGGVGIDLSLWNYNYSDAGLKGGTLAATDDTTAELSEVILALSFAGATFKYYDNVANADASEGYEYYTLGYGMNQYSGTIGYHDNVDGKDNVSHLDLTYAFNSNLSFTVSKILTGDDDGKGGAVDNDMNFVVSYSLPIL